jgi:hypothetical protein
MGGTIKYAAWNWSKGMKWSTCMDCLLRHLFKWWYCGEDIDPESGEHHLDHVFCNLFFLRHYADTHPGGDDRPPKEVAHFDESLGDLSKLFDEKAFLARNPDIKKVVEDRDRERIRANLAGLTGKLRDTDPGCDPCAPRPPHERPEPSRRLGTPANNEPEVF